MFIEPAQDWLNFNRMQRISTPFLAYRMQDVLPPNHYGNLKKEYDFFSSYFPWNHIETCAMDTFPVREKKSLTLRTFGSPALINAVEEITQLSLLPVTETGFHFHPVGQSNGVIHHDYVYVSLEGGDGRTHPHITFAPESSYARAFALIYYLGNDWANEQSEGGTALYDTGEEITEESFHPIAYVPPINNSALLFECSPRAWHGFIGNPGGERLSIVTWFIATAEALEKKYGVKPFHNVTSTRKALEYFRSLQSF